jgi:hypothetical protein
VLYDTTIDGVKRKAVSRYGRNEFSTRSIGPTAKFIKAESTNDLN